MEMPSISNPSRAPSTTTRDAALAEPRAERRGGGPSDVRSAERGKPPPRSRRRAAHVISLDTSSSRFILTSALLKRLGFEVQHHQPVSLNDPRVIEWENRFRSDSDKEAPGSPRPSISLSLSHLELWRTFPTSGEWLYIFEDDVMLNPQGGWSKTPPPYGRGESRAEPNTRGGKQTWQWPADAPAEPIVRRLLDEVEIAAASNALYRAAPLIYLGTAGFHHHRSAVVALSYGHTLRMCDTLNLHAYAIRRPYASQLADEVLRVQAQFAHGGKDKRHDLYRYNLDVMVRGYFMKLGNWKPREAPPMGSAPSDWSLPLSTDYNFTVNWATLQPLCVDMEEGGIMDQNRSLPVTVPHSKAGSLLWR